MGVAYDLRHGPGVTPAIICAPETPLRLSQSMGLPRLVTHGTSVVIHWTTAPLLSSVTVRVCAARFLSG